MTRGWRLALIGAFVLFAASAAVAVVLGVEVGRRAERIEALDDRVAALEESGAGTSARIAELEAALADARARTEKLEGVAAGLRERLSAVCSAGGMPARPSTEAGLPEAVAETRLALVRAATACDYRALAVLASTGTEGFTFSFGGGDDPALFWWQEELSGFGPLQTLVRILETPYAVVGQGDVYVWPEAFVTGGYFGYRVGIAQDGEWLYFVAGD